MTEALASTARPSRSERVALWQSGWLYSWDEGANALKPFVRTSVPRQIIGNTY